VSTAVASPEAGTNHSTTLLETALGYAARGWQIIPLKPRGKTPLTPHGLKDATRQEETIQGWWAMWPDANVGVVAGEDSGLYILDIDTHHGGEKALEQLEATHGALPQTFRVRTGSGGEHIYFRHPGGERLPNTAGTLGQGVDTRGDGGYVVAAGSVHDNGNHYEVTTDLEPAPLPQWLAEGIRKRASPTPLERGIRDGKIPEGARDNTLISLGGYLRRRGLDEGAIFKALSGINQEACATPLKDDAVGRIAASAASYEPEDVPWRPEDVPIGGEIEAFQVMAANEILELPDPDEGQQLLGPLVVRQGRLMVGADTGAGKTTFLLRMVKALVDGGEFLDWQAEGGLRVLIIDAEQNVRSIKRGLREVKLERGGAVDYLTVPDGLQLDKRPDARAALEHVLANGNYDVVVADPLYKLHDADSNDERAAVNLMRIFDAWRVQFNFSLLMATHTRKKPALDNGQFSMHSLFGSGAWIRGAEVVIGLERVGDGFSRLYLFKDRDGDLPVGERWNLGFSREEGFWRKDDGDEEARSRTQVRDALKEREKLTLAELCSITGASKSAVRRAVQQLEALHVGYDGQAKVYSLKPEDRLL
jgi:hypothetical protein